MTTTDTNARHTVLITGANRGIGLGLAQQYLAAGATVFCAARHPDGARELWEMERDYGARCRIVTLDVTDERDLAKLPGALGDAPLDLLINNAGVLPGEGENFATLSPASLTKAFAINVVGPLRVAQTLMPALRRGTRPMVATVSSKVGSISDNRSGGLYAYRTSKAAINMLNKCMAIELSGVICVVLHPGWVKTEMGGSGAPTSVEESASGIVKVLGGLGAKDSGRFLDFRGQELPW